MKLTPALAALGWLIAAPSLAQAAATPPPPVTAPIPVPGIAPPAPAFTPGIYGVIMEIGVGPDGRMKDMKVSRVIAMARESAGEISTPLPDVFLAAVQQRLEKVRFKEASPVFRFFVFDPSQPARADIGPPPESQNLK